MNVEYERVAQVGEQGVVWRFDVPGLPGKHKRLMFYATQIRIERGSQKAYIKGGYPGERAFTADDVELRDDSDRSRLANRFAEHIWQVTYKDAKAVALRERMFHFCDGLYEFWMGERSGGWVEGDAKPSTFPWAIPGLIPRGATSIHFGDAGSNKSTLERLLAQSLNHGINTVFPIRKAEPAIWVNAEEPEEEHKRQLGNVNQALGIERTSPLYTLDARGMGIAEIAPRLAKAIDKTGALHVFIDSLSRLAQGMNLNENATATLLIDSVSGLGPSMNFIGHTGQENRFRLAGSRHFENAARVMVRVQSRISMQGVSPELTRGLRTQVTKANGAIETEPLYWTLRYHRQHGLQAIEKADAEDWPVLRCEAVWGEDKRCNRRTWDGVVRGQGVRCARHREEEGD